MIIQPIPINSGKQPRFDMNRVISHSLTTIVECCHFVQKQEKICQLLSCISVLIQLFYYIRTFVQQFLGIADTCINKNNKSFIMRKL